MQDCDESDATLNCEDADGDGFVTCPGGCGGAPGGDPDDTPPCPQNDPTCGSPSPGGRFTFPVPEVYDGLDNDNDGFVDEDFDRDGDGHARDPAGSGPDCHDDPTEIGIGLAAQRVHPGAAELCDGLDNDCDAGTPEPAFCAGLLGVDPAAVDGDGDGRDDDGAFGADCDDARPDLNQHDFDGDGVTTCDTPPDCDDTDADHVSACSAATRDPKWVVVLDDGTAMERLVPATTGAPGQWVWVRGGDTIQWELLLASPLRAVGGIVPVAPSLNPAALCEAVLPYEPLDGNDVTGPMPHLAAGVFVMGPHGVGNEIVQATRVVGQVGDTPLTTPVTPPLQTCPVTLARSRRGDTWLCASGLENAQMDATWTDPDAAGVFIRLHWSVVHKAPGVFDWTQLDREVQAAVDNGKLYSLVFKAGNDGIPDWVFSEDFIDDQGIDQGPADKLCLRDSYSDETAEVYMELATPDDPSFLGRWLELTRAVGDHLRARADWYRALAYIKLSGMNQLTDEARLPLGCECGDTICNEEVWGLAKLADPNPPGAHCEVGQAFGAHPYTESGLLDFYGEQMTTLAAAFPDKETAYMLIDVAFPRVSDDGTWAECLTGPSPTCVADGGCAASVAAPGATIPTKGGQTDAVIALGDVAAWRERFVVQHNGARPHGVPNQRVIDAGVAERPTGYQTANASEGVDDAEALGLTFEGVMEHSEAFFLEVYETRFWEAGDDPLGPDGLTLQAWGQVLYERRVELAAQWPSQPVEPQPEKHFHLVASEAATRYIHYVDPTSCDDPGGPRWGVIGILPDLAP